MSATDDRHNSVTAAAAVRQSVEGASQSSYETPTYSSPGALRAYPSDAYSATGKQFENNLNKPSNNKINQNQLEKLYFGCWLYDRIDIL